MYKFLIIFRNEVTSHLKEIFFKLYFKKKNVSIKNFRINGFPQIKNKGFISIGDGLFCQSGHKLNPIGNAFITRIIVSKQGKLVLGKNVGISNTSIYCTKEITLGNNVMIGGGTKIWDTDFHSIDYNDRLNGDSNIVSKKIIIEDNVFIGGFTIILKGVYIGRNSVIGAGSVVTGTIPPNQIWGGNPAKFIREL